MTTIAMESLIGNKPQEKNTDIKIGAHCRIRLADARLLAYHHKPVSLSDESHAGMDYSYQFLKSCIDKRMPVYGINTNVGDQVSFIEPLLHNKDPKPYYDSINDRQEKIIKSLSCGLGNIVPAEFVRVTMMLRAHCLSQSYSGVSSRS